MSKCPYCSSEHFTKDYVPKVGDSGYNKCLSCDLWSLYDPEADEQQEIENPETWPQSQ